MADKELARNIKKEVKVRAKNNKKMCVCAFDLKEVLLGPHGECNLFYYKRRLKKHNLTVTDLVMSSAITGAKNKEIREPMK